MVAPFNGDSDVIWNHLVSLCCRHCKNIYKEVSKNVNFDSRNLNITAASGFSLEGGNTTVILVRGERIHSGPTKTFDRRCIAWKTNFGITFSDARSASWPRAHPLRGYSAGVGALLRNVSCSDQPLTSIMSSCWSDIVTRMCVVDVLDAVILNALLYSTVWTDIYYFTLNSLVCEVVLSWGSIHSLSRCDLHLSITRFLLTRKAPSSFPPWPSPSFFHIRVSHFFFRGGLWEPPLMCDTYPIIDCWMHERRCSISGDSKPYCWYHRSEGPLPGACIL